MDRPGRLCFQKNMNQLLSTCSLQDRGPQKSIHISKRSERAWQLFEAAEALPEQYPSARHHRALQLVVTDTLRIFSNGGLCAVSVGESPVIL